ncbi:FAD-binding oxidoreductase [Phycisphaeraceae bacterium D3-23]
MTPTDPQLDAAPRADLQPLAGWGVQPRVDCAVYRPSGAAAIRELIEHAGAQRTLISRGLGRSYGDPATNAQGVVLHTAMDRFLAFDDTTGVVTAEAGVSFADLIEALLPRGWFPAVTPGTKFVTLGGAVAADVHGKNHHRDGSFNTCVLSFDLLTPTGEHLTCSRDENTDVFWATLGGMGLTGFILAVTLQMLKVMSARIDVQTARVGSLDAMLEHFAKTDDDHRYSVSWIDCLARGAKLGRGVVMQGTHAPGNGESDLRPARRRAKTVPFHFPKQALNALSVKAFNTTYYAKHGSGRHTEGFGPFFYPLDAVHHWNRVYGRRGFVQYQPVFPEQDGAAGVRAVIEKLSAAKRSSFLAVLKRMGGQPVGPLGFPMAGLTLAVDMPRGPGLRDFLHELDAIVLDHGGRVYLAKDAEMTADTFAAMYPRLNEFQQIRRRLDPAGVMASTQARRLGIVGAP